MLYLLAAVAAALVLFFAFGSPLPRRYAVKAGRPDAASKVPIKPRSNWWLTYGLAVDQHGNPIETAGRFIGTVTGESMAARSLPNGATFVADYLSAKERVRLKQRDIVVVREYINVPTTDPKHLEPKEQFCLRSVRRLVGDKIEYEDDVHGPHDPHPIEQVVALVTRVIPVAEPKSLKAVECPFDAATVYKRYFL